MNVESYKCQIKSPGTKNQGFAQGKHFNHDTVKNV